MTMPAVVLTKQGRIALQDRPRPKLRPDQILVEVDLCGICGSDLHASQLPQVYRGDCILGHEPTGRVVEVGGNVADWAAGQRVTVNPNGNVDGSCVYCRSGRPNFCRQATLETALGLQADGALAPLAADAAQGDARDLGVDVALECSGSAAATSAALKLLRPGGILVVVGAGPDPGLDSATILLKEITVRGSYIYTDEFDRAIHLLATQQITVADLTTLISPLPGALAAFDALRAGRIMKALIAPGMHHTADRTQAKATKE
jgi:threonine dehydrogenase-like Zn-dependent dehydrogenase